MIQKLSEQVEVSIELMEVGLDRPSIHEALSRDEFGGRSEADQTRMNKETAQSRARSLLYAMEQKEKKKAAAEALANNVWNDIETELVA